MTKKELKELVIKKLQIDFDEFSEELMKMEKYEIIEMSYEIYIKRRIINAFENCEFSKIQYEAAMEISFDLNFVYGKWLTYTGRTVKGCVKELLKEEVKELKLMREE